MIKKFKPDEVYRLFPEPFETKEQLEQSNLNYLQNKFYKFRSRFGINAEPISKEKKVKNFREKYR